MRTTRIAILEAGFSALSELVNGLGEFSSYFVLADSNTSRLCYPKVKGLLPRHHFLEISSGEAAKTIDACLSVWYWLSHGQADRSSLLICIGGGMVTDLGGFCASVYKRGVAVAYLPTTLMAMADAAIGGKTGIDFEAFKNTLGTFYHPRGVFIFPEFLNTLSDEESRSGYAEMIKHAMLQGGAAWKAMESRTQLPKEKELRRLIEDSVSYKSSIVNQDPQEANLRKILNLGHTVGHALESRFLAAGKAVPHGYAIAAGLAVEAHIAFRMRRLPEEDCKAVASLIKSLYPKLPFGSEEVAAIARLTLQDKKNQGGSVRMALLDGIGKPAYDVPVGLSEIDHSLHWYATAL